MSDAKKPRLTRRQAIAAGLAGAASLAGVAAARGSKGAPQKGSGTMSSQRMPVVFLPHGGGPWPFVDIGWGSDGFDALLGYLRSVRALPKTAPKALLVVSAHWEEHVPTVMTHPNPPMLYDYFGFPPESYRLQWPAAGSPRLAARVRQLLEGAGIATAEDPDRGFDHGTFVPLKVAYPDAEVPAIQLSMKAGLDPAEHLAIGRALRPLRDEGVFIVGSGMSFHNLRRFFDPRAREVAEAFDAWLREAAVQPRAERERALTHWARAPAARDAHPREDHLLPLMVVAGAAGDDPGSVPYNDRYLGLRLSAVQYG